jgi:hypothetical protein
MKEDPHCNTFHIAELQRPTAEVALMNVNKAAFVMNVSEISPDYGPLFVIGFEATKSFALMVVVSAVMTVPPS